MAVRVLLVDDHQIMVDGLQALLSRDDSIEVVGQASTGRSALEKLKELSAQVVVMDVAMPDMNGMEATRRICEEFPHVRVVGLSMHLDRRFVVGMLGAGASGYVLKDSAFEELAAAIHVVHGGQTYLSPPVATVVVDAHRAPAAGDADSAPELTAREREVLQLIAEGHSTKEISIHLGVSIKTVETHRQNTMAKLGLNSVAQLTKYAIREGITTVDE